MKKYFILLLLEIEKKVSDGDSDYWNIKVDEFFSNTFLKLLFFSKKLYSTLSKEKNLKRNINYILFIHKVVFNNTSNVNIPWY